MKYYIIYETTCKINLKKYRGAHTTKNINDDYLGSGKSITAAIKKYGKENFYKEILFCAFSKKDMYWAEKILVNEEWVNNETTYNMKIGGEGGLNDLILLKIQKTNKKKYGHRSVFGNKQIQNKIEKTNIKKYGVKRPTQNKKVFEKLKKTNINKYGTDNVMKNENVKNKNYETNMLRRGVKRPAQDKSVREKTEKTFLKKYGVRTMSQIPEVKEKIRLANSGENSHSYGKLWLVHEKDLLITKVKPEIANRLIENGWIHGRGKKHIKYKYIKL